MDEEDEAEEGEEAAELGGSRYSLRDRSRIMREVRYSPPKEEVRERERWANSGCCQLAAVHHVLRPTSDLSVCITAPATCRGCSTSSSPQDGGIRAAHRILQGHCAPHGAALPRAPEHGRAAAAAAANGRQRRLVRRQ